jgi:deoxyribose-phosphate aldolase
MVPFPHVVVTLAGLAGSMECSVFAEDATEADVRLACTAAREYRLACVSVLPDWTALAVELLDGTSIKVCAMIAFPSGECEVAAKLEAAELAIRRGAREIGWVLSERGVKASSALNTQSPLRLEINALVELGRRWPSVQMKAAVNYASLSAVHRRTVSYQVCGDGVIGFVAISTGREELSREPRWLQAAQEDVHLAADLGGERIRVSAGGQYDSFAQAWAIIQAGAARFGVSPTSGPAILSEARAAGIR